MIVSKWKTENRCRYRWKWRELDYKLYKVLLGIVWIPIEMQMGIECVCLCVIFKTTKKRKFLSKSSIPYSNLFISTHNPLLFFRIITQTHTQTSNIHIHTLCWTMLAARLITFIRKSKSTRRKSIWKRIELDFTAWSKTWTTF